VLPKIDETHALSKPVTSNSAPTPQVSKVVKNINVISPGMFRYNPFKNSKEEKSIPIKHIKASVRTNPITISQPHVITKKDVNSDSNDLDEIEEVNANCILMANLQQASTSDTQTDQAPVYDSNGSTEVHDYDNCYNNEIFNMFTQEEQYTELLDPIPEPHQVQHNNSNFISEGFCVEQEGGIVEQHPKTVDETHAYFESLYNNLAIEVEKVNMVNSKLRETNANLTTELARYKNQEKCFEISQEKYDKLERCYQKFVYQEQCLTKKITVLHLSSGKQITALNEEISNLNNQLSKEKSTVSSLQEENKRLKSDFKIRKDELLDKQIQVENKIKELDNIL
nr:hypothetical protein [Tanacetum cinerariifolium]